MASSVAECEELISLAEKNGLTLMVGHTFLYSAAIRRIKEIIDHGDIGSSDTSARAGSTLAYSREIST